ncbi:TetR/AcrR family transcriptional regulator [Streptomyces rapamycinicus]|nr:TetR/AcrR family transcriptional regulator C-terminal domain-containing protein [Streptomyces rapamycinicus]MBB4787199.1 AcrR family transcriptional regulator [Streptomyces rapamycinicus]UTO67160.1 TetR/AcrR family transcriptional regulator C-terminal domain-containing protein [Streptomyces rapamycinicus]UTP35117.1 TetR/AcrR family transcriptional regulator C-terminal domain-containing protein [Streptomyces rapamycinicus NRRL 5491]
MHEPMTTATAGEPPPEDPRKNQRAEPRPGTAAWWLARESEPARQRRRRSLTLDAVLDAAMTLLDTRGAAALTMRNIAEALGCTQASLYRHVRNREELVTLLVDRAVAVASSVPPDGADWAEKAAWSSRLFREHLLRHPGVASLLRGTERLGTNSLAGVQYSLELFIGAGLSPRLASAAASSLATFVLGSVHLNLGLDMSDPEESRHRRLLYRSRDAAAFPLLVQHADALAEVSSDDEFEVGLNALLTGFRALIQNSDITRD